MSGGGNDEARERLNRMTQKTRTPSLASGVSNMERSSDGSNRVFGIVALVLLVLSVFGSLVFLQTIPDDPAIEDMDIRRGTISTINYETGGKGDRFSAFSFTVDSYENLTFRSKDFRKKDIEKLFEINGSVVCFYTRKNPKGKALYAYKLAVCGTDRGNKVVP